MIPVVILAAILVLALGLLAASKTLKRQRETLPPVAFCGALTPGVDGAIAVPVLGLILRKSGGFGGMARNSLNPALALTPAGLDAKVIGRSHIPWAEVSRVDVAQGLLGAAVQFKGRSSLRVTVRDLETARQVLAALPGGVMLGGRAAALLRDGRI
jgi:hypothetical protein